ncbi:hypothetical protein SNE35_30690 [Paucibacter sp. R3-3]|uniref:PEP-CTERM protein-sorting domain-containing protein n=1 Tax=Roseateles agri TaxID=3098619 RepID=A0ABU5DSW1_9BURK|nr:hypothetical protein [Paucibacter sp. R3-3]MDY0748906.1 hypothetical protein [Paucibacter sp. R3-3]
MKTVFFSSALLAAALSVTPAAHAGVSISVGPHQSDATSGKISPYWGLPNVFMETFDLPGGGCGLNGPPQSVAGGPWGIVKGSLQGAYAAPAGDSSCYAYAPVYQGQGMYAGSALPADAPVGALSAVDILYQPLIDSLPAGTQLNYVGLYYGSIDHYDKLEFYSGTTLVATVSGTSILDACGSCTPGDRTSDATNAFVNLYFTPDIAFNRLRFVTYGVAVEVDNVAVGFDVTPVPEPPAVVLAGAGLATLLWIARRRRSPRK